jgi:hypothetical protein
MQCTRKQVGGNHVFREVLAVSPGSQKSAIIVSLKKLCCPLPFMLACGGVWLLERCGELFFLIVLVSLLALKSVLLKKNSINIL